MVVPLPKCEKGGPASGQPINVTLFYGGLSCTVDTVQNLTGLKIQFAGLITFKGVISMSNAVGGVPVCRLSATSASPSTRPPVPQSSTRSVPPSVRTSTHDVLPP
jgi:anionic cell wall polymer biosynthesis LytR-Cps2A-Psr (LCP) family protein